MEDAPEEWRIIPGFEAYEASSLGRIRRIARARGTTPGRVKVPQLQFDGYLGVNLFVDRGKAFRKTVHHLVCRAFHGVPPAGTDQCAHKDGTKLNNVPSNLEWTNAKGNADDRRKHGTHPAGAKNGASKLDEPAVKEIRRRVALGEPRREVAVAFGVCRSTVDKIATGAMWAHATEPKT